jgi:hypothetical protein
MKEFVITEEIAISVKEFFTLFLADEKFKYAFHEKRGDSGTNNVALKNRSKKITLATIEYFYRGDV